MSKEQNETQREREAADLTATAAAFEAIEGEVSKLRSENEELNDRVLRGGAELENFRKRARRELEDERRYALAPFLKDFLPVLDDLFRAIVAAEKAQSHDSLLAGVKMIAQGLLAALARHHCTQIDALHKPFDPAFHTAIMQQASTEFPPHTVILVAQDGYMLHDRVIRPAQVIVSIAPTQDTV
jgi:molecular chaperone GrpE